MYLENIFIGSEDIRRQLPAESQLFDAVHTTFMRSMGTLAATINALAACTTPGLLETFQVGGGQRWYALQHLQLIRNMAQSPSLL
jgi:hypothetical protein